MTDNKPLVSVIIPTHNRCDSLQRTLNSLDRQTYPNHQYEVIVVADGCTDRTVENISKVVRSLKLRIIEQPKSGAAVARNLGARNANGKFLLFLDDDVVSEPGLIEAHYKAHQNDPGHVVIGPYPPYEVTNPNFLQIALSSWWRKFFSNMSRPYHRFTYRDLISGNLSIEAGLFFDIGGFDSSICGAGAEDWELGIRLIKAEIPFYFCNNANAVHYPTFNYEGFKKRSQQEGYADVIISRRHPELIPELPFRTYKSLPGYGATILRILAFRFPYLGDATAACLRLILYIFERLRLRNLWLKVRNALGIYWYWRGFVYELRSLEEFESISNYNKHSSNRTSKIIDLDLGNGLELAEKVIDETRPDGICIRYGNFPLGFIQNQPGTERIKGKHLRDILLKDFAAPLLEALTLKGIVINSQDSDKVKLAKVIRDKMSWSSVLTPDIVWPYQLFQWKNDIDFWEQRGRSQELEDIKIWYEKQKEIEQSQA